MSKKRSLVQLLALTAVALAPFSAHAAGVDEASPSGKGIVGGALLGAEAVLVVEAALEVKPAWAYIVGGVAGGAAGGVGGYFVEQTDSARPPMLMLAGGLVLAIPTLVAVLSATAYEPPADFVQDRPSDEPVAEPPRASEVAPAPALAPTGTDVPPAATPSAPTGAGAAPAAAPPAPTPAPGPSGFHRVRGARRMSLKLPPPALFGTSDDDASHLALGVPAIELYRAYTRTEIAMYGVPDVTEVKIPVLSLVF